jgi:magnesium chelatase subunit D
MTPPLFPFAALVGLAPLRLALQLAAIDARLSVLARGDKGAGKTTAVRGVARLLQAGAPFVNLPIGATEERLLGGLDLERALKGEPALKPGLLAAAHGGVLYVDEVNLLPDHLADALLDAVASGTHIVEREGFSAVHDARFVLVGTMNPEEGALRPQLLDRFALAADVSVSLDPTERRTIVERRLDYDRDPQRFMAQWQDAQEQITMRLSDARARLGLVVCPPEMLDRISQIAVARGVRSLRADLALVRASQALAALSGDSTVTDAHVDDVLPLVMAHRATTPRDRTRPPPPLPEPPSDPGRTEGDAPIDERVFRTRPLSMPKLAVREGDGVERGTGASAAGDRRGPVIGARLSSAPGELDLRRTMIHAVARPGPLSIQSEDVHEKIRAPQSKRRYVFVVDASGSHAVRQRMEWVKGAVLGLLEESLGRKDEVAVVAFRGAAAHVLLEPTTMVEEARRALEFLATGGRTPLAHALDIGARYVTDRTIMVLLTDGRANVARTDGDAWADALAAAAAVSCPALVIDSESGPHPTGRAREIAEAMSAAYVTLDGLEDMDVVRILREPSGGMTDLSED